MTNLPFKIESWLWYGFVALVVQARLISRVLHFGHPKRLQLDDWLMCLALCFYTTEIVTINIVSTSTSNLLPPGYLKHHHLGPKDVARREYGSKMVLVVEQCQISTIWLVKACLLLMYHRLTVNSFRRQNIAIKVLSGYVVFGWAFMEIFYFGVWCRPFYNYWAVPTPNPTQCAAAINHLITNAVFNISSDIIMLAIALPMFLRSKLPLQRKAVLCSIFGLGAFVIVCACLNKYYSFTHPFGLQWTYWYIRESSTAMLVANLPFTWTLLRRVFGLRSFSGDDSNVPATRLTSSSGLSKLKDHFARSKSHTPRPQVSAVSSNSPASVQNLETDDKRKTPSDSTDLDHGGDMLRPRGRRELFAMAPLEEIEWDESLEAASRSSSIPSLQAGPGHQEIFDDETRPG